MPADHSFMRTRERGNVLLLTLLALILFAAICYALIIPAGEVSLDQEKELVSAAQITQYPAMLRTTVRRMLTQGVVVQDLDFTINPENNGTAASVFGIAGGQAPRAGNNDIVGSQSRWRYKTAPVDGSGSSTGWFVAGIGSDSHNNKDVFAFLDGITEPVCMQILRALGLPEDPLEETVMVDFSGDHEGTPQQTGGANGADTARSADEKFVIDAWAKKGKPQPYACVRNGADGSYVYYHILVDR